MMIRVRCQMFKKNNILNKLVQEMSVMKILPGQMSIQSDTNKVQLRGSLLESNTKNNLDMIFIGEMFDQHANWAKFFSDYKVNEQRNIYMISPRNFGNSDRNESLDIEEMSNDVIRFMDSKNMKQATLAGHGFGGKLALSVGCYHSERVTGVCVIDSGPLDHRYYEPHIELVSYLDSLANIDMTQDLKLIHEQVKNSVDCPKWRKIFLSNIKQATKGDHQWDFNMPVLHQNLKFNKEESLGVWNQRRGMFSGRTCFIFPDQSRWVHLNTNTIAMLKTCARLQGYNQDVFAIQSDDSPLNHWVYDFEHLAFNAASKLNNFLFNYDGVPLLMMSRQEMREGSTFMSNYTHRNLKYPGQ